MKAKTIVAMLIETVENLGRQVERERLRQLEELRGVGQETAGLKQALFLAELKRRTAEEALAALREERGLDLRLGGVVPLGDVSAVTDWMRGTATTAVPTEKVESDGTEITF